MFNLDLNLDLPSLYVDENEHLILGFIDMHLSYSRL